jgi:hypothetical protein
VGALLSGGLIATTSMASAFLVTAGLFAVAGLPVPTSASAARP